MCDCKTWPFLSAFMRPPSTEFLIINVSLSVLEHSNELFRCLLISRHGIFRRDERQDIRTTQSWSFRGESNAGCATKL